MITAAGEPELPVAWEAKIRVGLFGAAHSGPRGHAGGGWQTDSARGSRSGASGGSHENQGSGAQGHGQGLGDHRAGPRPAQGRRGACPVRGGRAVPLGRPPAHRRHPGPLPDRRRARGGGDRRGDRRRREQAQAGRPRGLLVPAGLRALPLLRAWHDQPVRPRRAALRELAARRHVPVPRGRRGLRPDVPARHVLPAVGGLRALLRQDRRRPAARDGGAGRLRGADRLGHRGERGRRPAGRHDRDLRNRRRRDQRRPGCGVRGRAQRHRGRPAGQQERE